MKKQREVLQELEAKLVSGEVELKAVDSLHEIDAATLEAINAGWKCVIQIGKFGIWCS